MQLIQPPVVHSDESNGSEIAKWRSLCPKRGVGWRRQTSWWLGGTGWWLWVFTNKETTPYLVGESRRRDVSSGSGRVLGTDYPGVLVSDCLSTYDDATRV